jgi:hypothetical protein
VQCDSFLLGLLIGKGLAFPRGKDNQSNVHNNRWYSENRTHRQSPPFALKGKSQEHSCRDETAVQCDFFVLDLIGKCLAFVAEKAIKATFLTINGIQKTGTRVDYLRVEKVRIEKEECDSSRGTPVLNNTVRQVKDFDQRFPRACELNILLECGQSNILEFTS